jgi:hypothetical protein
VGTLARQVTEQIAAEGYTGAQANLAFRSASRSRRDMRVEYACAGSRSYYRAARENKLEPMN